MLFFRTRFLIVFLFLAAFLPALAVAQDAGDGVLSAVVDVADEVTLVSEDGRVMLWGVKRQDVGSAVFELNARTALDRKIAGHPVSCFVKSRDDHSVSAQCVNAREDDLALYMLQSGYVTLDRAAVLGTVYEMPYIEAEAFARSAGNGVWGLSDATSSEGRSAQGRDFMRSAFFLVLAFIVAIVAVTYYIMRGFGRVISLQNKSMDMMVKERELKEREKNVIASVIHAEIRENKPKIEAYLTVYEEMLVEAMNSDAPAFTRTGEVVQKQPALSRSVFDGNTGKLDMLGSRTASNVIHYYARIKTKPDYVEISSDMPIEDVRAIIQSGVDYAKKMEVISNELLELFCNHSVIEVGEELE